MTTRSHARKLTSPLGISTVEGVTLYSSGKPRTPERGHSHVWCPPTDVTETKDTLVVTVKIAGMEQSQFNISLQKRKLTIAGIRGDVACPQAYHQMGVRYGEFRTEVEVPAGVDPDSLEANYSGGFLEVVLLNIRSCVTATAG